MLGALAFYKESASFTHCYPHVSEHRDPSAGPFTNCSFHWSQQSLYLPKGSITLPVKSETSVLQKCRVQVGMGHFAICTQQTTSTGVTSSCVPMSDDRMVRAGVSVLPPQPCSRRRRYPLLSGISGIACRERHGSVERHSPCSMT